MLYRVVVMLHKAALKSVIDQIFFERKKREKGTLTTSGHFESSRDNLNFEKVRLEKIPTKSNLNGF